MRAIASWPRIQLRELEDPTSRRFHLLPPVDWHPELTLADLEPPRIRALRESGATVWAIVEGKMILPGRWGEPLSPDTNDVSFSYRPGWVHVAIVVVSTVAQVLIARSLRGHRPPPPTYAFGPIQTQYQNGVAIPLVYGNHRVGGVIISLYTSINDQGDFSLNMLVLLSEGPIASVATKVLDENELTGAAIPNGILINGVEANQIPGVTISTRTGTIDQAVVGGFSDTRVAYAVGQTVSQGFPITYRTTGAVEGMEVLLTFPGGLYYQGKTLHSKSVPILVKYQKLASQGAPIDITAWIATETTSVNGSFTVTRKQTSSFTVQKNIANVAAGYYAIEVSRLWIDDGAAAAAGQPGHVSTFNLDTVNEVTYDNGTAYPLRALLALKAVASERLNGQLPRVNCDIQGKLVYVWTSGTVDDPSFTLLASNNNAWVAMDLLTNVRYGMGEHFDLCQIDLQSFKDWSVFCDELILNGDGLGTLDKRFECNIVFDEQRSGWDQAQQVAAASRASLFFVGSKIRARVEQAASPVQLFSMGNIVRDSFRLTYLSRKDRPNYVEVQFLDSAAGYSQATASWYDVDLTELYRKESLIQYGITKAYQAYRQAKFHWNLNEHVGKAIEFEAGWDALASEPGDVIAVQDDVAAWAHQGGRVLSATSTTVELDRTVSFSAGQSPRITVRSNAGATTWAQATFAWNSALASGRNWTGTTSETLQTRAITLPAPTATWSASTFTWGSATAQNQTWGTYPPSSSLTVTSAWDAGNIPQAGDLYIFAQSSSETPVGKRYRLSGITRTQEGMARIEALEYNSVVYDDDPGTLDHKIGSGPPDPGALPPDVTGLALQEVNTIQDDGTIIVSLYVSWVRPTHTSPYTNRVYLRTDSVTYLNPTFGLIGETTGSNFIIGPTLVEVGQTYTVAVTSRSPWGAEKDPASAPSASITLQGNQSVPPDVTGFSGYQQGTTIVLNWTAVVASDLAGYEIRKGGSWTGGVLVATNIQGTTYTTSDVTQGTNTFWLKARNTSGNYSTNAARVDITYTPAGTLVGGRREEDDWTGTRTNFTHYYSADYADGYLETSVTSATWAASTYTWGSATGQATVWAAGASVYETLPEGLASWQNGSIGWVPWSSAGAPWTYGVLDTYDIQVALDVREFSTTTTWAQATFSWESATKGAVSDWRGVILDDSQITTQIKIAISTNGGVSYGAFATFVGGPYTADHVKFRIESSGASASAVERLYSFKPTIVT